MTERPRVATRAGLGALCVTAGLMLPVPSLRALEIEPRIAVATIYTDNVTLAPGGQEDGDFVGRLEPGIHITGAGQRYDFEVDYVLELLYFNDQDDSTAAFNQGTARLELEVLPEHFLVTGRGRISQMVIDPRQPIGYSNIPVINNRTDATVLDVAPEWRQEIAGHDLNVKYTTGTVDYDADELQDVDFQQVETDLSSPERERGLGWSIRHEYWRYEYELPPEVRNQFASLSVFWNLRGGWTPYVTAGAESDVDDRTDGSLEDGLWYVGLRRSTEVSALDVAVGDRSFGSTFNALLERRRAGDEQDFIRLSYSESPRTTEDISLEAQRPFPEFNSPVVPPELLAPGRGAYFVQKRGDLTAGVGFSRHAFELNLYDEEDKGLLAAIDAADSRAESTGGSITWTWTLGGRTEFSLLGLTADQEYSDPDGTTDDYRLNRIRAGLLYRLGARTALEGWLSRQSRHGSEVRQTNYDENQIGLSVERTF